MIKSIIKCGYFSHGNGALTQQKRDSFVISATLSERNRWNDIHGVQRNHKSLGGFIGQNSIDTLQFPYKVHGGGKLASRDKRLL